MGLVATILLGPRNGRWTVNQRGQKVDTATPSSVTLLTTGTWMLYFGWFGFNCGSTLAIANGAWKVVGVTATNTFLCPSAATITMMCYGLAKFGSYRIVDICNALLASLVAITAG